jgi:hypothetical protein
MTYYQNWSKTWIEGFNAYCDHKWVPDDLNYNDCCIFMSGWEKAQELEINFPHLRIEKSMATKEARKRFSELLSRFDTGIAELKEIVKELE